MMQVKRWSDLTTEQQTAIRIAATVQMTLLVAALWDMWRRPVEEINGDRRLWTLASFVNFVGPVAYFLFGRKRCCECKIRAAVRRHSERLCSERCAAES
jgi:hypothetical protein